ncbi:MAG: hypothetical protein J6X80_00810 [Lachnospiraceae bacterium]|nr:hypothetical protein [Lachnospiraceae bacterium]
MEKKTGIIVNRILSIALSFIMMFVLYYKSQSVIRLVLFCLLAAVATIITMQIKPESFFRCLTVCFAFLPKIAFKTDFKVSPFDFTGFKAFAQVVIMYSDFLLLFAPAAMILLCVAIHKDDKKNAWQILKKFIPCAVIMLLCFLASAFYNPVANLCLFVFTYAAIIPVACIAEKHVYKDDSPLLTNLPYYFLVLVFISRYLL